MFQFFLIRHELHSTSIYTSICFVYRIILLIQVQVSIKFMLGNQWTQYFHNTFINHLYLKFILGPFCFFVTEGSKKWRELVIPTPLQYFCCHCGNGVNVWSKTTVPDLLFIRIWCILAVPFNPLVGGFSSKWHRSNKLRQTCSKLLWKIDLHTSKYILFPYYL